MVDQIREAPAQLRARHDERCRPLSILRLSAVKARLGLSRSTIYDRLDPGSKRYDPTFPKPISLGERAVGWVEREVEDWIARQVVRSRQVP